MISIIIPTYNNLLYLKKCIESINKNSFYKNEVLVHVNQGNDGTEKGSAFFSELVGIFVCSVCVGVQLAAN